MKKYRKMLLIMVTVLSLVSLSACAGPIPPVETTGEDIITFSEDRMMDVITHMSAEDGGRIAGTDGERLAAEYITGKFESIGLEVSSQEFPMTSFTCDKVSLESVDFGLLHDIRSLSFSAATPAAGITAEIIPVGMGADADYEDVDLTDKIALIMRGGEFFRVKTQRAYENGAVAVIFYDPNGEEAIAATLTELSRIPAVSIAREDALNIEGLAGSGKSVGATIVVDSHVRNSMSSNVIAVYESDDNPDNKFVVLGAHYDGVDTPAANDNASGIAVLLEIAAVLSEHDISLPFDVEFVAFGSEEIGLVGSEYYVRNMSRTDLGNILAMLNYDMVGVGEYFELLTLEGSENAELIKAASGVMESIGRNPVVNFTERSDHASFARAGIQAVDVQTSPSEYYHTDDDTIDKINPGLLTDACELGIGLLTEELPGW